MPTLHRIIRFKTRSQVADKLSSMKHPNTGKIVLFSSYDKAKEFIEKYNLQSFLGTYPDDFNGTVTKRYIIDPE